MELPTRSPYVDNMRHLQEKYLQQQDDADIAEVDFLDIAHAEVSPSIHVTFASNDEPIDRVELEGPGDDNLLFLLDNEDELPERIRDLLLSPASARRATRRRSNSKDRDKDRAVVGENDG